MKPTSQGKHIPWRPNHYVMDNNTIVPNHGVDTVFSCLGDNTRKAMKHCQASTKIVLLNMMERFA